MAKYTMVRISRDTKQKIEEMKPDGVAWHVVIDYLFESYLANDPNAAGHPESWVHDLFTGRPEDE
jgi:hypothetical protein